MIKVRYQPGIAIGVFLLGCSLTLNTFSGVLAGLIVFVVGIFSIAFYFRPFLIIQNNKASCVSLISNEIKKEISTEELAAKSEGMRWFLRKSDFEQLGQFLKKRTV